MDKVIVLDFGSQYTQLIARKVRELKVYCEILPGNAPVGQLKDAKALILSGGPASVSKKSRPEPDKKIFELGIPILGICYGMQITAELLGGKVSFAKIREYGGTNLEIIKKNRLFFGLKIRERVWMSHGDSVLVPPKGFEVLARTHTLPIAAFQNKEKKIYGVQFHPEVAHTPKGKELLKNFLFRISDCSSTWTMGSFIEMKVKELRSLIGQEKVLCALSGGVDSSVLCTLLYQAIGQQLNPIFVNNGLVLKETLDDLRRLPFAKLIRIVPAQERFLRKLSGVLDPEKKRKIIGAEFIKVFEEEAKKLGGIKFLAQGTLYPDVIESARAGFSPFGGSAATIKTHHNVGGLPEKLKFHLIEPLKDLFKDEVRILGKELGLPHSILTKHPFPGPGLAVRIIGAVTKKRVEVIRKADAIIEEEIRKSGYYEKLWQSFAVLLPVKTVGVMGDERTYEEVIAIRAVKSRDAMTADWADLPHRLLSKIANRIINEVKGINRVVYDISSKPPSTIEWE